MTSTITMASGTERNVKIIGYRYIAAVFTRIEKDGFRIYVAWEQEAAAKQGSFRWYKAPETCLEISEQQILKACDYGTRVNIAPALAKAMFSNNNTD